MSLKTVRLAIQADMHVPPMLQLDKYIHFQSTPSLLLRGAFQKTASAGIERQPIVDRPTKPMATIARPVCANIMSGKTIHLMGSYIWGRGEGPLSACLEFLLLSMFAYEEDVLPPTHPGAPMACRVAVLSSDLFRRCTSHLS